MLVTADVRAFASPEEKFQHCLSCSKEVVVLPEDRRRGLCFDCFTPVGPMPTQCPECDYWLEADTRPSACPRCGYLPNL